MKTAKEFEQFFEYKLKPRLEELEQKRKASNSIHNFKTYRRALLVLLVLVITDVTLVNKGILPEFMLSFVFVCVLFTMFYPLVVLYFKGSNFLPVNEEYKQIVIKDLVHFVDENLKYDAKNGLTEEEFNNTKLFHKTYSFKSEDLISGEVNGINYRMADVKALGHRPSNVRTNTKSAYYTIFEGLYVIATYKNDFGPSVFIRYRNLSNVMANKFLEFLGNETNSVNSINEPGGIHLATGNSNFDSLFYIVSENEESARKIITPAMIDSILGIKEKLFGKSNNLFINPINIFLSGNEAHFALFELDVFDLNALTSITKNNYTQKYYNFLCLAVGLAEILK